MESIPNEELGSCIHGVHLSKYKAPSKMCQRYIRPATLKLSSQIISAIPCVNVFRELPYKFQQKNSGTGNSVKIWDLFRQGLSYYTFDYKYLIPMLSNLLQILFLKKKSRFF